MEQEKKKNWIIILLVIIIAVLLILGALFMTNKPNNSVNNELDNTNEVINTSEDFSAEVKKFLVDGYFISESDAIGSLMPSGFVFLEDGRFAYHSLDFASNFVENEDNRIISYIGTWEIQNNKLVLSIIKEEHAVGGKIVEGPPYNTLVDYTKEIKNVDKIVEYSVVKYDNTDEYLKYVSLLSDGKEINWYDLPGVGDYINVPKALAENGYNDAYYDAVDAIREG